MVMPDSSRRTADSRWLCGVSTPKAYSRSKAAGEIRAPELWPHGRSECLSPT